MNKMVKFVLSPEEVYRRLDKNEKEKFKSVIFTKANITDDGLIEIEAMCMPEEDCEKDNSRRFF